MWEGLFPSRARKDAVAYAAKKTAPSRSRLGTSDRLLTHVFTKVAGQGTGQVGFIR